MNRSRTRPVRALRQQRGVVTLEYALMLMFGLIPLLFLTYTGVMMMAAQQTLSVASAEGARAALRFAPLADRRVAACQAARRSMQWLTAFSGQNPNCNSPTASPVVVSVPQTCPGAPAASPGAPSPPQCITVTVSYDYQAAPFLPGTGRLYGWTLDRPLSNTAVAQLDLGSN